MRGNIKSFEKPFTHAEVVALAERTLKRFGGDRNKAGRYARSMESRYESSKWAQVVEVLATSRQHHATRKTPAQLNREIAQALHRRRDKATLKKAVARAHSTIKAPAAGPKQEELLMVANDAALSGQYGRAEKIVGQSKQRAIATAFTTVTEESSAAGDYASRGWEDEEGDDIEVDADDIEGQVDVGSQAPVTDAIVDKAVQWLRDHGASETSSTRFRPGTWYETEFEMDYGVGEEKQEEFFLRNFTAQEEKLIFERFNARR